MTVSTIFLQSTNEGENEYSDTTFAIHVPAQNKSYKLSVASFMFRPHIILMDTSDYMTLELEITRLYPPDYDKTVGTFYLDAYRVQLQVPVSQVIKFNPSQKDVTDLKDVFTKSLHLKIPIGVKKKGKILYNHYKIPYSITTGFSYSMTPDNRLELVFWARGLDYKQLDPTHTPMKTEDREDRDAEDQLVFKFTSCKLVDISPKLAHFTGLKPGVFNEQPQYFEIPAWEKTQMFYDFSLTAPRCYNPQYWNYITLSCNKTYNSGNIVNQERFNSDIDESSQFYKGQILAYMPNNAYAPEAMQTGMATANEYIIQPADFNSIRFWLNYDNGEPVRLCSPMTIVLNMMPNQ